MESIGCSETPVTINQRCVTSLPKTLSYTAAVAWNRARLWPNFHWQYYYNYSILSNIRSTKSQHYFLHSSFEGRVIFEELSLWTRYLIRFQSIQIIYHDTNKGTLARNAVSVFLNTSSIWKCSGMWRCLSELTLSIRINTKIAEVPASSIVKYKTA
jgi:hypothetical protein